MQNINKEVSAALKLTNVVVVNNYFRGLQAINLRW